MAYGTLNTFDTLAASQQTIAQYGEDNAFSAISAQLAAHNSIWREALSQLVEMSTDRQRRYGGPDNMSMDEVDEFGRGDAQKLAAGATVGFPLRLFDLTVQWTRKYFQNKTGAEFAAQFTGVTDAHRKRLMRELKKAVFVPTNNPSYLDRLIDGVQLSLKALANADSATIPVGPNGEVFDASVHTHYLARAGGSLAASDVSALITTVREHFATGNLYLLINQAQESTIRGFTANFTALPDARIIVANNVSQMRGDLEPFNPYNRRIGLYDSAEVWVKPWVPANYLVAYNDAIKPLVFRERAAGGGDLAIAAEDEAYPLRARTMEAEFGIGVWQRVGMAVLFGGNTTYAAPTITD